MHKPRMLIEQLLQTLEIPRIERLHGTPKDLVLLQIRRIRGQYTSAYSDRSAIMGSTFVARRAGM
jgi:hypothetical protein